MLYKQLQNDPVWFNIQFSALAFSDHSHDYTPRVCPLQLLSKSLLLSLHFSNIYWENKTSFLIDDTTHVDLFLCGSVAMSIL